MKKMENIEFFREQIVKLCKELLDIKLDLSIVEEKHENLKKDLCPNNEDINVLHDELKLDIERYHNAKAMIFSKRFRSVVRTITYIGIITLIRFLMHIIGMTPFSIVTPITGAIIYAPLNIYRYFKTRDKPMIRSVKNTNLSDLENELSHLTTKINEFNDLEREKIALSEMKVFTENDINKLISILEKKVNDEPNENTKSNQIQKLNELKGSLQHNEFYETVQASNEKNLGTMPNPNS
jgi:hypothetical protein